MNFHKKQKYILSTNIRKLNYKINENNFLNLLELLDKPSKLFIRNLFSGISKGIGFGIGVTLISAFIILILERLVSLNIPVIGEYISDIIKIVEQSK